jgi:hypothetical protein
VHYFHTGNFIAAADWFERAAGMPNAPPWLSELAAVTKAEGGNRQGARQILTAQLQSPDKYIRDASTRTLQQLDALDRIDGAQKVVNDFLAAHNRFPSGWAELIQSRALPGIPVDPVGNPLTYDAATGRVSISPASTALLPLPQMLKSR